MKKVKLTPAQFGWLSARLSETYRAAAELARDLESFQTISFYKRNNAEDIRLRTLRDCVNTMQFCKDFAYAITNEKGGKS